MAARSEEGSDPLDPGDITRIARKLWGDEIAGGDRAFYPSSSDEVEAIYREKIRELRDELAGRSPRQTVQEIQLHLIQRHTYNAFDGERVYRDLLAHRHLWNAVLMDPWGLLPGPGEALGARLVKLRDLPEDFWNVDTLYVLAVDEESARALASMGEHWSADCVTVHDAEMTERALGAGGLEPMRLVTFWWD